MGPTGSHFIHTVILIFFVTPKPSILAKSKRTYEVSNSILSQDEACGRSHMLMPGLRLNHFHIGTAFIDPDDDYDDEQSSF